MQEMIRFRLGRVGQRYTPLRAALVETLAAAGRPLTVPEVVDVAPELPLSSAYRNITVLIDAGVIKRVLGTDDHGRFELTEELSGHHHHLICTACGKVEDLHSSEQLETTLGALAESAAKEQGYQVLEHRLDLVGLCRDCQALQRRGG
jgi:Fe2+ or Zn2+ uptake regulation protein